MALTEKKVVGYLLSPRPSPGGHEHLPSPSLYTGTEYRMCCSLQAPTTIKTYIVYTAVVGAGSRYLHCARQCAPISCLNLKWSLFYLSKYLWNKLVLLFQI